MSNHSNNNGLVIGKALEKDHDNFLDQMKQGSNNIMVVVRTRPLNAKEAAKSTYETVKVLDERVAVLLDPGFELNPDDVLRKNRNKEMQFAFDYVYDKTVGQDHIYKTSVQFLISGVFEGFNGTVFAYGATGAGKTYTMIGNGEQPGIMERAMNDVFRKNEQMRVTKDISIKASYIEIYNETIKDLLTSGSKHLELREDPSQGVVVSGITEISVSSTSEILHLLKVGNKNRTIESTGANEVSSRSHAVLQVMLQIKDRASGIQTEVQYSKLSLVDLAGSERASSTNNRGIRLIEGAKINQSLLVLGNCIQALSEATEKNIKNQFVQYRGSKLTRMLKDSLGGNCRTVMIANVSPHMGSFEDTYNTLNFANRAKSIKTHVTRNYLSVDNHISNYTNLIDALKKENENLKRLLRNQSSPEARDKILNKRDEDESGAVESADPKDHYSNYKQQPQPQQSQQRSNQHDRYNSYASPTKSRQPSIYQTVDPHSDPAQQQDVLHYDIVQSQQYHNSNSKQRNNSNNDILNQQRGHQIPSNNRYNFSKDSSNNSVSTSSTSNAGKEKSANKLMHVASSSTAKERQINYLKNQLRLRDDIIKDQKNILNAQNIPQYEGDFDVQSLQQQHGSGSAAAIEHQISLNTDYGDYQYQSIIPSEPNLPSAADSVLASNETRPFEKVKVRAKSKIEMSKNVSPSAAAAANRSDSDYEAAEPFRLPRIGFTSPTKKQINNSLKVNNYKFGNVASLQSDSKGGNSYGFASGANANPIVNESGRKKEHSGSRPFIHQSSQQASSVNNISNTSSHTKQGHMHALHSNQQYPLERSYSNKRVDTNENPTVPKFDSRTKSPSKRDLSENYAQSPINASIDLERRRRQQKRSGVYSSNVIDSSRYQSAAVAAPTAGKLAYGHALPQQQSQQSQQLQPHPPHHMRPSSIIGNSGTNSLNNNNNIIGQVMHTNSNEVEKSFRTSSSSVFSNKSQSQRPRKQQQQQQQQQQHQQKDMRIQMYLNKEIAGNSQQQQSINSDVDSHPQSNQAVFYSEKKDPPRMRTPRASDQHQNHHNHHGNYRAKDTNTRAHQMPNWNMSNDGDENPIWTPSSNQKLKLKQLSGGSNNASQADSTDLNIIMHERHKQQQQQQLQQQQLAYVDNERKGVTAVATAAQILAPSPQHLNQIRKPKDIYANTPGLHAANNAGGRDASTEDHRFNKIRQSQDEARSSLNLRGGDDRSDLHKHDRLKYLNYNLKNLKHQDIKVQHSIDTAATPSSISHSNNNSNNNINLNNYGRNIFQQENVSLMRLQQMQQQQQMSSQQSHISSKKQTEVAVSESRDRMQSIARRHYPQSQQSPSQQPQASQQTQSTTSTNSNLNSLGKRNFGEQRSERSISAIIAPSSRLGLPPKN